MSGGGLWAAPFLRPSQAPGAPDSPIATACQNGLPMCHPRETSPAGCCKVDTPRDNPLWEDAPMATRVPSRSARLLGVGRALGSRTCGHIAMAPSGSTLAFTMMVLDVLGVRTFCKEEAMDAAIPRVRAPKRMRILPLSVLALIVLAVLLYSGQPSEPAAPPPVPGACAAGGSVHAAPASPPASAAPEVAKAEPVITEMRARRRAWQPEQVDR
jgi:hypothetical protein